MIWSVVCTREWLHVTHSKVDMYELEQKKMEQEWESEVDL